MPDQEERETREKAQEDLREGKSPSTAAGEFVREEIDHVREGVHGARSPRQAIAIGLSKARRAGIPLQRPAKGKASTKESAERDYEKGQSHARKKVSAKRSRATTNALKKEPKTTASRSALSKQTRSAASKRSASSRRDAAAKAVRTKAREGRSTAAKKKAARTKSSRGR
ncbi:MAG TPA: DNA-binding protein [Acidobacteriaceae bacterium]|nr:DNA-binding protein [Acidobacteriaceae bacterium]